MMKLLNKIIMLNTQKINVYMFSDNNFCHHMKWWLEGKGLGLRELHLKFHFRNVVIMASSSEFIALFQ